MPKGAALLGCCWVRKRGLHRPERHFQTHAPTHRAVPAIGQLDQRVVALVDVDLHRARAWQEDGLRISTINESSVPCGGGGSGGGAGGAAALALR